MARGIREAAILAVVQESKKHPVLAVMDREQRSRVIAVRFVMGWALRENAVMPAMEQDIAVNVFHAMALATKSVVAEDSC